MAEHLSGETLLGYVRVLAEGIGPRPAGHLDEAAARHYIRSVLEAAGIDSIEEQRFLTPDTWGYALIAPTVVALAGNLVGAVGRLGKLIGGVLSLVSAFAVWRATGGHRQLFSGVAPTRESANLIARFAPGGPVRRRVVLIGHTDTNKHRPTHAPGVKHLLLPMTSSGIVSLVVNGAVQLLRFVGLEWLVDRLQRLTVLGLLGALAVELADETGEFVDGANDNASAVACLLGIGQQLAATPLAHTEVWLAFTGAEEVGSLGMHAMLDAYDLDLGDAWFIDFEMVGAPDISYVTRHSGFSYFNAYTPDGDSLALAARTAAQHPALDVTGRPMTMVEEVGALRGRGFRGLCIVGVGEDGWLQNWHRASDTVDNIDPGGLERAARFAWAMMQDLDAQLAR